MARQQGIDLADVAGHGPGGIITREDLAAHLATTPRLATARPLRTSDATRSPVHGVQKHMAEAMVRSATTAPQACVFLTVDVTPTLGAPRAPARQPALRGREADDAHLGGAGGRAWPSAITRRSTRRGTRRPNEIVTKHYVNLGIAVAGPRGLVVPNVKDAHDLRLRDLATGARRR